MEEDEIKLDLPDVSNLICRCCLCVEKPMILAAEMNQYFMDLAGINVLTADGLPQHICLECSALLRKAIGFKYKMLRAQTMLYEYATRCAPFPIDAHDPELLKFSSPELQPTETLIVDSSKKKHGFHKVLEHTKIRKCSPLDIIPLPTATDQQDREKDDTVKEENGNEFDDDLPLLELRSLESDTNDNIDKSELGMHTEEIKTEPDESRSKKKKEGNSKKTKKIRDEDEEISVKKSIRKPIEIDPTKIRIVHLNPEEQFKQREQESKASLKFPFSCHLCFKGFNFESKLENHMSKHSPSRGRFECTLCKMYLPTAHSFGVHSLIHNRRYECLVCGRRMVDKISITHHYRTQHEGIATVITCHLCGKISSNSKTHRGHMRNHHSGERPKCDQCGKSFVNKDSLIEHLGIHSGVKHHQCNVCGKFTRTRGQLKLHMVKHNNAKDYYCVECDIRFKTPSTLKQHLRRSLKHRDLDSFKHVCPRCPRRFDTAGALRSHIMIHHERLRPFSCTICGAALATEKSLQVHKRSVHGARPEGAPRLPPKYQCHTCGKAFGSKSILANHIRTHTGEKPHACGVCGRAFAQRAAARTHARRLHAAGGDKAPKSEPPVECISWPRQQEIYYVVTAGP